MNDGKAFAGDRDDPRPAARLRVPQSPRMKDARFIVRTATRCQHEVIVAGRHELKGVTRQPEEGDVPEVTVDVRDRQPKLSEKNK